MLYINFIDTSFSFVFKQTRFFTLIHYIFILSLVSLNQNFHLLFLVIIVAFLFASEIVRQGFFLFILLLSLNCLQKNQKFPSVVLHCRWVSIVEHTLHAPCVADKFAYLLRKFQPVHFQNTFYFLLLLPLLLLPSL